MKVKVFILSLILLLGLSSMPVSAQVTVSGSTSQDGSYATLASAFTAIGATAQSGLNIIITLSGSTTEPSAGAILGAGTWNSLKIYPTVSGITITNELISSLPLIKLDGADNVTIDGRVNQTGAADMIIDRVSTDGVGLIYKNTSDGAGYTSAPTVTMSAPPAGGTTATAIATISAGGVVNGYIITNSGSGYGIIPPTVTLEGGGFSTAATAKASTATNYTLDFEKNAESNTIQYCILKGNSYATKSIVWFGNGVTGITYNGNGNNILQNNLFTGNASGRPLFCIYSDGVSAFPTVGNKILNNEFKDFLYQKANTSNLTPIGLFVKGGAAASPSPNNAWTITGNSFYDTGLVPSGTTGNNGFTVIQIGTSGNPAGTGYTISDNYIGGSAKECGGTAWTKTGEFDNIFTGIYLSLTAGGITNSVQNNTIKNISWTNSAGTANTNTIWKGIEIIAGDANIGTVTGNSIGDNTTTGSITYTAATTGTSVYGIYINNVAVTAFTVDCQNNKIGSITVNNSLVTGKTDFTGIAKSAYGGTITISNNTIGSSSVVGSLHSTNNVGGQAVCGITCSGTGTNTISGNIIANLINGATTSYANKGIIGILVSGGTNTVNGNFITSFSTPNSTGAYLYGISISGGTGTYSNNIISLGNSYLNTIYGIYDTGLTGTTSNIYFNTLHISGSPASGTDKSYCLYSAASANTRDFRNNIFSNIRPNGGGATGKHFAVYLAYTDNTGLTMNYNDYFVTNATYGRIGYHTTGTYNALNDQSTLSAWQTATGQDANSVIDNPVFANAGGATAVDLIPSLTATTLIGVSGTGIITDFAGSTRYSTPRMGAFESSFIATNVNSDGLGLTASNSLTVLSGAHLTINASTTINGITVERGGKLTNNSGQTLTLATLTLKSDASGTATYVDNGTSAITTGNVQQYLTGGRNWYVSSPVASAASSVLANASSVYKYDEPTSLWQTESSTLSPVKGYVAEATSTGTVTFTGGILNTGAQSVSNLSRSAVDVTKTGYNLVGNPYPSYVNWGSATKTNLLSTMWYRSKNAGNTAYVFDTYNATGSAGTGNNGTVVTAAIPPMQAFWVKVTSGTGTLAFDNTMRSHEVATNRLRAAAISSQQILRLQVSNAVNSDEALVLFNTNASDGYDAYDSPKMTNGNASIPEIYTTVGTEKLVINGLNSVITNSVLPLGFTTGASNTFTIKATEVSNFDADTRIFLKDVLLNTEQDITDGAAYSFTSDVANTDSRFSLLFKTPTATTEVDNKAEKLVVSIFKNTNGQITINSNITMEQGGIITVYNTVGQRIIQTQTTGASTVINKTFGSGVYLVTVNVAGKTTTKKLIFN